MKRIQMRDIPEEEEAVREEFTRVKKKLGIRSNIRLYRNDRITQSDACRYFPGAGWCYRILPTTESI